MSIHSRRRGSTHRVREGPRRLSNTDGRRVNAHRHQESQLRWGLVLRHENDATIRVTMRNRNFTPAERLRSN